MSRPVKHRGKWRIRWTDALGARQSEVFAEHRDALFKLNQHLSETEEVKRGLRLGEPPSKTFSELADYWIAKRASQKRSGFHDESIIRRHLRPAFGDLKLKDVGVEAADRFVADKAGLDRKTISNHLTLLIAMLNAAVDLGWLLKAPRIRKPRIPLFTEDFRFLQTDEEVMRLLAAAREEGELAFALYATAIYTGMRQGELAGLRWGAISFERRLIAIQRSFEQPTKAGDVRYVPIFDVLLPTLRQWRLKTPGDLVFPNRDAGMHGKSARIFQEVFHRALSSAGFPEIARGSRRRRYIVFHDLRHTFASHWVMKGGDIFKLQKLLGHKSIQMTMRYAHLAPAAFASDYARFGVAAQTAEATILSLPKSVH